MIGDVILTILGQDSFGAQQKYGRLKECNRMDYPSLAWFLAASAVVLENWPKTPPQWCLATATNGGRVQVSTKTLFLSW